MTFRRAVTIPLLTLGFVLIVLSGVTFVFVINTSCHFQQRQWRALNAVIVEATRIPDGYPATPEQRTNAKALRERLLTAAGTSPRC